MLELFESREALLAEGCFEAMSFVQDLLDEKGRRLASEFCEPRDGIIFEQLKIRSESAFGTAADQTKVDRQPDYIISARGSNNLLHAKRFI